jgi:hypothetical protein
VNETYKDFKPSLIQPASTVRVGQRLVEYAAGPVLIDGPGTWYIYVDDPEYDGGEVSYQATRNAEDLLGKQGRVYFGKVTFP